MKSFIKLESGIKLYENICEGKRNKIPNVDVVCRVETTDIIDQYIITDKLEHCSEFEDFGKLENVEKKTYKEIEIKTVDEKVIYTIIEGKHTGVGTASLFKFNYMDAVEVAKSIAKINLEEKKLLKYLI